MGYTNSYTQRRDFNDDEWQKIKLYFRFLLSMYGDTVEDFSDPDDLDTIVFNGKRNKSDEYGYPCEDLVISKKAHAQNLQSHLSGEGIEHKYSCKTRANTYDHVVWEFLVYIKCVVLPYNDTSFSIEHDVVLAEEKSVLRDMFHNIQYEYIGE